MQLIGDPLCREAALACMRRTINLSDFEKRISPQKLGSLAVTTYDFHTTVKLAGPSVRR